LASPSADPSQISEKFQKVIGPHPGLQADSYDIVDGERGLNGTSGNQMTVSERAHSGRIPKAVSLCPLASVVAGVGRGRLHGMQRISFFKMR